MWLKDVDVINSDTAYIQINKDYHIKESMEEAPNQVEKST